MLAYEDHFTVWSICLFFFGIRANRSRIDEEKLVWALTDFFYFFLLLLLLLTSYTYFFRRSLLFLFCCFRWLLRMVSLFDHFLWRFSGISNRLLTFICIYVMFVGPCLLPSFSLHTLCYIFRSFFLSILLAALSIIYATLLRWTAKKCCILCPQGIGVRVYNWTTKLEQSEEQQQQ